MINSGIFDYEKEDADDEVMKMKCQIPEEIKRKTNTFLIVFSSGVTVNTVLFPISQLILLDDRDPIREDPIVNPFLPPLYFIYNPFNTHSVIGYSLAYFLVILILISVYGVTTCMTEIYVTCAAQIKVHSRILIYSLKNLQKRAFQMYIKNNNIHPQEISLDELFEHKGFESCMYACFRSNVQHHQALLRFKQACQPYCGAILLDTVTVALVCYVTALYLVFQKQPPNTTICCLVLLMTEQTYTFFICYFGEEVIQESGKLFETLYKMQWFHYSKRFNKSLVIMMGYAKKPFSMQALLLDVAASIETFGDLVSTVYKMMNLLKQSDKM